jgi:hypothetical protein
MGDVMFVENVQRFVNVLGSRDALCWRAESSGITDNNNNNVACRAVAMQRPRDGGLYQGRFSATAR